MTLPELRQWFPARAIRRADVGDGELGFEEHVIGGAVFCTACEVIVSPDLHVDWHRRRVLGPGEDGV